MSNDDYLEHFSLFYDQKVKFLSNNPIHSQCKDCEEDKVFEENNNKLLLSCGDDSNNNCSTLFIVNLPQYIHKMNEIESFKKQLKKGLDGKGYNFDILYKYNILEHDIKKHNDHKEDILTKIEEIRKIFSEVNLKNKSEKINEYYDNRVNLLNEANRTLYQIQNNNEDSDNKKTLRHKYVGIIKQLNSENQEVQEFINKINPYIMKKKPSVEIVDPKYLEKLKLQKHKKDKSKKPKNVFYKNECEKLLCSKEIDIHDKNDFYSWAKKNHPNKKHTDNSEEKAQISELFNKVKKCHEDKEWCPYDKKQTKEIHKEAEEKVKKEKKEKDKKEKDKKTKSDIEIPKPTLKKKPVKPVKKSLTINDFKEDMKVQWTHYGKTMNGIIGKINKRKKKKIEVIWENGDIKEVNIDKLKIIKE